MARQTQKMLKGSEGFDAYYSELYKERWPRLREALFTSPRYIALPARNSAPAEDYFLDAGSISAALSLPIEDDCRILDMCAAPGGKSLILASRIASMSGSSLVCNEVSGSRRNRLVSVLNTYVSSLEREKISITGYDAARWCRRETECFDRILLDAPCSSERHVLQDAKYLAQWSPARIKHLAHTQWALLSSAFRLLKSGGYLLYATCALSPAENDEVVQKLFKKFQNARGVSMEAPELFGSYRLPRAEASAFGMHILPDTAEGAGPMYFSLINKLA
ncbi:RsmB/NOP family class I SAM-dependent RNA methyltransferase [Treponema sp. HNW]|uniref:RsmB/NOP family class I SAM-dependent RNA methyltransferase n=1 Tax=Treponema sp. HNW TaxID=3116654 RepID=UPI003D0FA674